METDLLKEKVNKALEQVIDPELGLDVVNLGLVYSIRMGDNKTIEVEMTLTTPGCPVAESLPAEAKYAIETAFEGEYAVDINVVWDPPWTPAMLSETAKGVLGFPR